MKDLAQELLSPEDRERIRSCVAEVEETTSGEIVPMVVSACHDYARAEVLGAVPLGMALALGACLALDRQDMWTYALAFALAYLACFLVLGRFPALKRPFISGREKDEAVREAAMAAFYAHGLHRTSQATGILIFISVFERRAWVLADQGINARVDPAVWTEVVDMLTTGIRAKDPAQAVCRAVRRCGDLVAGQFPICQGDVNELPDLVVEGEPS